MIKTEKITIRITKELREDIEKISEEERVPMAQWVRNAVIDKVEEYREKKKC